MFGGRGQLDDARQRFVAVGGSIGAERHDGFPVEVIAFRERMDNHRGRPPPDRTADKYRIVLLPILDFVFNSGAGVGLLFGFRYLGARGIFGGIRLFGFDAEQRTAGKRSDMFGNVLRIAAPAEIGDKDFLCSRAGIRGRILCISSRPAHQNGKQGHQFRFHIRSGNRRFLSKNSVSLSTALFTYSGT